MADEAKDLGTLLVDAMALRVDGPAILFIRPRRALTAEDMDGLGGASQHIWRHFNGRVVTYILPHDFDIMVLGDAELAELGLARVPLTAEVPADGG